MGVLVWFLVTGILREKGFKQHQAIEMEAGALPNKAFLFWTISAAAAIPWRPTGQQRILFHFYSRSSSLPWMPKVGR